MEVNDIWHYFLCYCYEFVGDLGRVLYAFVTYLFVGK